MSTSSYCFTFQYISINVSLAETRRLSGYPCSSFSNPTWVQALDRLEIPRFIFSMVSVVKPISWNLEGMSSSLLRYVYPLKFCLSIEVSDCSFFDEKFSTFVEEYEGVVGGIWRQYCEKAIGCAYMILAAPLAPHKIHSELCYQLRGYIQQKQCWLVHSPRI